MSEADPKISIRKIESPEITDPVIRAALYAATDGMTIQQISDVAVAYGMTGIISLAFQWGWKAAKAHGGRER